MGRALKTVGAVVGSLLVALMAWVLIVHWRAQREDEELDRHLAELEEARMPKEPRQRAAAQIWHEFDGLRGEQFRTLAMLQAYRARVSVGLEMLPPDEQRDINAFNGSEFRQRAAELMMPGESSMAVGEANETLIPSTDLARCRKLSAAWAVSPAWDRISAAGFKQLACLVEARDQ